MLDKVEELLKGIKINVRASGIGAGRKILKWIRVEKVFRIDGKRGDFYKVQTLYPWHEKILRKKALDFIEKERGIKFLITEE